MSYAVCFALDAITVISKSNSCVLFDLIVYEAWQVMYLYDGLCNRVICPYCGYRLPISYNASSSCKEISVVCKGRNCKRSFMLIIRDGVQRNVVPDIETIEAFKKVFGDEYKKHIQDSFGVVV